MIFIADLIACSTCFGEPLCPSSGVRDYYTSGCCLSYLVLCFSSCRYGVELRVMCPVCGLLLAANKTGSNHLYNNLELLMMGIMVPEKCWASNEICNKYHLLHLVGILFPHIISAFPWRCPVLLAKRLLWQKDCEQNLHPKVETCLVQNRFLIGIL